MDQEFLKNQFVNFANFNLHCDVILEAIGELISELSTKFYNEGKTNESNRLTTCDLIIKEIKEAL